MKKELNKVYEPAQVEDKIYKFWMDGEMFKAQPDPEKEPYCIVMPPPNITGQLHMVTRLTRPCRTYLSAGRE